LIDSDALLLVAEWPDYRTPTFKVMNKVMNKFVIFDGRNIYSRETAAEFGFDYHCIGIKTMD